jgi:3-hydroxy-3-methylglutaryl CoA synthase
VADLEFACKAGTEAMKCCIAYVGSKMVDYAMAIGSDTAQGRPGDELEYTAASGGAAYIFSRNKKDAIARIDETYSFTTDTPDFWRRNRENIRGMGLDLRVSPHISNTLPWPPLKL